MDQVFKYMSLHEGGAYGIPIQNNTRSLTHLELSFVQDKRERPGFIYLHRAIQFDQHLLKM